MTTPTINGVSLLKVLEDDALIAAGSPLLTLITAVNAANADPIKIGAAWIQFQGNLAPALLTFEATVASQVLGVIGTKLTAAFAAAQTQIAALSAGSAAPTTTTPSTTKGISG